MPEQLEEEGKEIIHKNDREGLKQFCRIIFSLVIFGLQVPLTSIITVNLPQHGVQASGHPKNMTRPH